MLNLLLIKSTKNNVYLGLDLLVCVSSENGKKGNEDCLKVDEVGKNS